MSWSRVQKVSASLADASPGTSLAATLGSAVTAGNLLVVSAASKSTTATLSVSDNLGNTYASVGTPSPCSGGFAQIFYVISESGGSCTVTLSSTVSTELTLDVEEISGIDTSSPLDGSAAANGSSASPSSGSVVVSQSGDFLIGALTVSNLTVPAPTMTAGSGFTDSTNLPGGSTTKPYAQPLDVEYQNVSSNTAATWTLGSSALWSAQAASFKAAPPSVTYNAPFLLVLPLALQSSQGTGAPSVTFQAPFLLNLPLLLPATILGESIVEPSILLALPYLLPAVQSAPSPFTQLLPQFPLVFPAKYSNSGTATYNAPFLLDLPLTLQPEFVDSNPILRLKRGPYATIAGIALEDGEPALAGVVVDSTVYYLPLVGGHDGSDHAMTMLVEVVSAKPTWTPPRDGIVLWDNVNFVFYASVAGAWKTSGAFS